MTLLLDWIPGGILDLPEGDEDTITQEFTLRGQDDMKVSIDFGPSGFIVAMWFWSGTHPDGREFLFKLSLENMDGEVEVF